MTLNLTDEQIRAILSRQRFLSEKADEDYDCYVNKEGYMEWRARNIWKFCGISCVGGED
jgi:hypothetical protein